MTEIAICDKLPRVGRKMLWPDKIVAPLAAGSLDRIKGLLGDGETQTDFLRQAIEREIKRRERSKP